MYILAGLGVGIGLEPLFRKMKRDGETRVGLMKPENLEIEYIQRAVKRRRGEHLKRNKNCAN